MQNFDKISEISGKLIKKFNPTIQYFNPVLGLRSAAGCAIHVAMPKDSTADAKSVRATVARQGEGAQMSDWISQQQDELEELGASGCPLGTPGSPRRS